MELDILWEALEQSAIAMERGEGDWNALVATAQESIKLIFDFTPEEIVQRAENSNYPTRPLIQWLLHEGKMISDIRIDRLNGLRDYWNERNPEGRITNSRTIH